MVLAMCTVVAVIVHLVGEMMHLASSSRCMSSTAAFCSVLISDSSGPVDHCAMSSAYCRGPVEGCALCMCSIMGKSTILAMSLACLSPATSEFEGSMGLERHLCSPLSTRGCRYTMMQKARGPVGNSRSHALYMSF